jgi:hypothetical protein
METPCVNVCLMDVESGLCCGCGRTVEEIGAWFRLGDAERRRIMAELPARMEQAGMRSVRPD